MDKTAPPWLCHPQQQQHILYPLYLLVLRLTPQDTPQEVEPVSQNIVTQEIVTVMLSTLIRNITMSPAPHATMSSGHFVSPPQLLIQSQLSEIHHGMVQ